MQNTNSIGQNFITLKGGQQFEVQQCYCRGKSYSENISECMSNIENGSYNRSELGSAINSYGLFIVFIVGILALGKWALH